MLEQAFKQLSEGSAEGAAEAFSSVVLAFPDEPAAYRGRAVANFQRKAWKEAKSDFERAKHLEPSEPENWLGYGMSLAMQLEVYPALKVLEEMTQQFPTFVRGFVQLANVQFKLGAISKGKEILRHALTLRPTRAERSQIEATLNEQEKLDARRYYRPDFEALRKKARE